MHHIYNLQSESEMITAVADIIKLLPQHRQLDAVLAALHAMAPEPYEELLNVLVWEPYDVCQ